MRENRFQRLLRELEELTHSQRKRLGQQLGQTTSERQIYALIEQRLGEQPSCPHCGALKLQRWGLVDGLQRYRCKGCAKTFNALTGTPMARLRHRQKWWRYGQELAQGSSVREAATVCGVHRNTSFRWRHRFLGLPRGQKPGQLSGIAEADETYFLESFKGRKRGLGRKARKRGGKAKKRGTPAEQIPVLIARDRSGATTDQVLNRANTEEISHWLGGWLAKDTVLCADGAAAYRLFAQQEGIVLKALNLSAGIRVLENAFHIQNVNAYDSRLKGWMQRFHGVATRYLPSYLGWRRLLERHANRPSPHSVVAAAVGLLSSQHLTMT